MENTLKVCSLTECCHVVAELSKLGRFLRKNFIYFSCIMTESQKGLEGISRGHQDQPHSKVGSFQQAAQVGIQMGLEYHHRMRLRNLSRQLVSALC